MVARRKRFQGRNRSAPAKLALAGVLVSLMGCSLVIPTPGPPAATSQPPFPPTPTHTVTPTSSPPTPPDTTLPFETIDKNESNGGGTFRYNETGAAKAPRFILLTQAADVEKLEGLVSEQALEKARALDFSEDWAVVVFSGMKPTTGYEAEIVRVVSEDGHIVVEAALRGPPKYPPPGQVVGVGNIVTLPYHFILLKKEGLVGERSFYFEANGEVIQSFDVDLSQR